MYKSRLGGLFALVLTLILSGTASAQDAHDGNLWRTLSRELKVSYVQGLLDGMVLGVMLARESLPRTDACQEKYIPSYQNAFKREIEGVSPAQIADGVDTLFKDYRNRSLLITDAIYVTLKAIGGTPPEDVEKLLQSVRRLPK